MTDKSVQFSCSVMSDSLQPHGLQHARPPFPSPTPRVYSNSCALSWWCQPIISSSVVPLCHPLLLPFSIFPSIRIFSNEAILRIRWPKYWSFSFSISPSNEYSELTDRSISTKPWFSICKLNDSTRDVRTVPRHYLKTKEGVAPQLLEWTSHSLAYEITQLGKTNCTTVHGHHNSPLPWPIPCGVCFFLNPNKFTSYLSLCLSLNFFFFFFCNEISWTWASLGPETKHHGFWLGSWLSEQA